MNNANLTKSSEPTFALDKLSEKWYTKNSITQTNLNAFDNDATANSALDYLYSNDNRNKTQSFLKNNGFPSAQEREYNKELYGVQEEQKNMQNLLKNKTNSILNPSLPNDTDRAFLKGLMGDEEEERDYQNQVSSASRAQKDLQNAFQGTNFLTLGTPINNAVDDLKYAGNGNLNKANGLESVTVLDQKNKYDITDYSDNTMASLNIKSNEYNRKIKENAKMNDKSVLNVKRSSNIIAKNADSIKKSANKYGVNPAIIAACIYTEQVLNYNVLDLVTDKISFINPSVGIGQVRIETAKTVEKNTNIEKIQHLGKKEEWHGNNCVIKDAWYIPGHGTFIGTKEEAISKRLKNDEQCIEYVAAYLKLIQDMWRDKYPIIDGKTDILASLYNMGEYGGDKGINSDPKPNEFGDFAKKNYYYMQYLLGIK